MFCLSVEVCKFAPLLTVNLFNSSPLEGAKVVKPVGKLTEPCGIMTPSPLGRVGGVLFWFVRSADEADCCWMSFFTAAKKSYRIHQVHTFFAWVSPIKVVSRMCLMLSNTFSFFQVHTSSTYKGFWNTIFSNNILSWFCQIKRREFHCEFHVFICCGHCYLCFSGKWDVSHFPPSCCLLQANLAVSMFHQLP